MDRETFRVPHDATATLAYTGHRDVENQVNSVMGA
jgi:hypothetical protein